jgi:hypothetical protein
MGNPAHRPRYKYIKCTNPFSYNEPPAPHAGLILANFLRYIVDLPSETEPLQGEYYIEAIRHIFYIGTLLVQLGLGELVVDVDYGQPDNGLREPTIKTVPPLGTHGRRFLSTLAAQNG